MEKIQAEQAILHNLVSEWELSEAKMLAEIKQKEAEMHQKLHVEKTKL